jgi:hypothetical protein
MQAALSNSPDRKKPTKAMTPKPKEPEAPARTGSQVKFEKEQAGFSLRFRDRIDGACRNTAKPLAPCLSSEMVRRRLCV